jgi:hypothetical protein
MTENKVATPIDVDVGELIRVVPVGSLAEALNAVADPRHKKGKRHSLGSILCLAVCAMLCGAQSQYAVAQWGRDQGERVGVALGFRKGKTPCVATIHRIFTALDTEQLEKVLGEWFGQQGLPAGEAIAIDGKGLRGIHGEELPSVHLVAAYGQWTGIVLGQKGGKNQRSRVDGSAGLAPRA